MIVVSWSDYGKRCGLEEQKLKRKQRMVPPSVRPSPASSACGDDVIFVDWVMSLHRRDTWSYKRGVTCAVSQTHHNTRTHSTTSCQTSFNNHKFYLKEKNHGTLDPNWRGGCLNTAASCSRPSSSGGWSSHVFVCRSHNRLVFFCPIHADAISVVDHSSWRSYFDGRR